MYLILRNKILQYPHVHFRGHRFPHENRMHLFQFMLTFTNASLLELFEQSWSKSLDNGNVGCGSFEATRHT
jgi:hypothetical protein